MNISEKSPNNNYVFDPESSQELARLITQDQFVTKAMCGPLAGIPVLPEGAQILDMGCGPGGWVLDVAFQHPQVEVAGIDISRSVVSYAIARASSQGLSNASFEVMDITHALDFADASFDLVNARFLFGVLKREAWFPFIAECTRLLRPGGILRLTETDTMGETLSSSLASLNALTMQVLWKAGYGFSSDGHSFAMLPGLIWLLKQAGYSQWHINSYVIDSSTNSQNWANIYRNTEIIFHQMKPLFIRIGIIEPKEFDLLYKYAMAEICAEDFVASGQVSSIWVKK